MERRSILDLPFNIYVLLLCRLSSDLRTLKVKSFFLWTQMLYLLLSKATWLHGLREVHVGLLRPACTVCNCTGMLWEELQALCHSIETVAVSAQVTFQRAHGLPCFLPLPQFEPKKLILSGTEREHCCILAGITSKGRTINPHPFHQGSHWALSEPYIKHLPLYRVPGFPDLLHARSPS